MSELCLHVITQDCAERLRLQLEVVLSKPYFDVIRYCDGGSEDDTKKVIRKFAQQHRRRTRVEYHKRRWDDNYSAQDNVLLDQASEGDWILVQDSDEIPSVPLLEHLREIAARGQLDSYDMVAIPAITSLDGKLEHELTSFIAGVREGTFDPFRKHWFFRHDGRTRMLGSPHREPRRLQSSPDAYGNLVYRFDWSVRKIPYPYIHYKTTWDFVLNDVLHAWIDPSGSGYTLNQIKEMCASVPSRVRTSKNLRCWLLSGVPTNELIWSFAEKHRNSDKAIRNWWPVLCKGIGEDAEVWV